MDHAFHPHPEDRLLPVHPGPRHCGIRPTEGQPLLRRRSRPGLLPSCHRRHPRRLLDPDLPPPRQVRRLPLPRQPQALRLQRPRRRQLVQQPPLHRRPQPRRPLPPPDIDVVHQEHGRPAEAGDAAGPAGPAAAAARAERPPAHAVGVQERARHAVRPVHGRARHDQRVRLGEQPRERQPRPQRQLRRQRVRDERQDGHAGEHGPRAELGQLARLGRGAGDGRGRRPTVPPRAQETRQRRQHRTQKPAAGVVGILLVADDAAEHRDRGVGHRGRGRRLGPQAQEEPVILTTFLIYCRRRQYGGVEKRKRNGYTLDFLSFLFVSTDRKVRLPFSFIFIFIYNLFISLYHTVTAFYNEGSEDLKKIWREGRWGPRSPPVCSLSIQLLSLF